jgi:hypothetical protein
MKKVLTLFLLIASISCEGNTPEYYNVCGKSDAFTYMNGNKLIEVHPSDSLYLDFCQYLSEKKNFIESSKSKYRSHDMFRFDFLMNGKRIKSIYIWRWINPESFRMQSFNSNWEFLNTKYDANIEKTKDLLQKLDLIN